MKYIQVVCALIALSFAAGCNKASKVTAVKDIPNSVKVIFAVGDVKILAPDGSVPAKTDMSLSAGSTILTGALSQCNILIGDASYVSVKENSKLAIESVIKKSGTLEQTSLNLASGRLVVNPKKLLREEGFSVKTPTAVAAVRGTKFVVTNDPGSDVKIEVIEGKVEMKPSVPALDIGSNASAAVQAAAKDIQGKVDAAAVIIDAHQSATIKTKSVEALNKTVSDTIRDVGESSPAALSSGVMNNLISTVSKVEITKDQQVLKRSEDEIKELDTLVKDEQKKLLESTKKIGTLTVSTPVKNSVIKVNDRTVGYGAVTLKVESGQNITVKVMAKEFEVYQTDVSLNADEEKVVDVALVRSKLKDRVDWAQQLGSGIKGDLVFYNGMIIAASSDGSLAGMSKEGALLWRAVLPGGLDSTPAVSNHKLFAVTRDGVLFGVNAANGQILWKEKLSGALVFGSSPMIADDNVIVATSSGTVYSFSDDGKKIWDKELSAGIFSSPAKNDGLLYVGADDHMLYALSMKKGAIEWTTRLDARIVSSSPVVHNGRIYVGTYAGTLYCLNVGRGTVAWTVKTGGPILSSVVCYKGNVYIGSKDSTLYAIASESGKIHWRIPMGQPVSAEVSILGNELFAAGGRTVYSIDYMTGRVNWSYELNAAATSVFADGTDVYVGAGGQLVSLRIDLKDIVR